MIVIECDGASRGNPGPAAASFRIVEDGNIDFICACEESIFLGVTTNNVAEYTAVLRGLQTIYESFKYRLALVKPRFEFRSDSQLVINQLTGAYKVRNKELKKYYDEIQKILDTSNCPITFTWVPREQLQYVDRLNNITLDKHAESNNSGEQPTQSTSESGV